MVCFNKFHFYVTPNKHQNLNIEERYNEIDNATHTTLPFNKNKYWLTKHWYDVMIKGNVIS